MEEKKKKTSSNSTLDFLIAKKKQMQDLKSRKEYNNILKEVNANLINTVTQKQTIDQSLPQMIMVTMPRADGSNDFLTLPRVKTSKGSESDTPRAEIPIAFSKILVAASAIAANVPDGMTYSMNKIKARAYYEMWKRSWATADMNGANALDFAVQQMLTTGTGAWRVFPKQIIVDTTKGGVKTKKILYDDMYREPLDMNRTWFGTSYRVTSEDNRPEVLYEIDITIEAYKKLKSKFSKRKKKGDLKDMSAGVSQEAQNEDSEKVKNEVTLTIYECPLDNRYIIASTEICFYDGEMPNEEIYGSVIPMHCFHKNQTSQYGIGFWELMRGNQTIQNYIESMNVEQVASEIIPMIIATGNIQGDMMLTRSSSKANVLPAGSKIERMLTTGNSTLGMNLIERKKNENDDITGINNIVAGSATENTLGSTVIMREAALNRLLKPRNSLKRALEKDACILFSWFEQDYVNPRGFVFTSEEEVETFKQVNPMFQMDVENPPEPEINQEGLELDTGETPSWKVFASMRVPVNFDYENEDLEESDYSNQPIDEVGDFSTLISRKTLLDKVGELDSPEKIGYDKVLLIIDPNSMLTPSAELQKQTSFQWFPIVQNTIMQIFGMAKQDPEQAMAQLKTFKKFLEIQRLNIYDFIPKELYDKIMQAQMMPEVDPMQAMMSQMQAQGAQGAAEGQNLTSDGTPVGQPQSPEEMPQATSPLGQAVAGGVTNMGQKAIQGATQI